VQYIRAEVWFHIMKTSTKEARHPDIIGATTVTAGGERVKRHPPAGDLGLPPDIRLSSGGKTKMSLRGASATKQSRGGLAGERVILRDHE